MGTMSGIAITEGAPNYPTTYTYVGRGGAGNLSRSRRTADTTQRHSAAASILPPDAAPSSSSSPTAAVSASRPLSLSTGRGGAGNAISSAARPAPSSFFSDELDRLHRAEDHIAPFFHIGRGGQGNAVVTKNSSRPNASRSDSHPHASDSISSTRCAQHNMTAGPATRIHSNSSTDSHASSEIASASAGFDATSSVTLPAPVVPRDLHRARRSAEWVRSHLARRSVPAGVK